MKLLLYPLSLTAKRVRKEIEYECQGINEKKMKKSICKVVAISIATDNREERQKGGE